MEEQNNKNLENEETEIKEEITEVLAKEKKTLTKKTKIAIIIGGVSLIIVVMALILIPYLNNRVNSNTPHTHTYGSWSIRDKATCTEFGLEERECACGFKETRVITPSHNFAKSGICLDCHYGWVKITMPETPITIWDDYDYSMNFQVTKVKYELGRSDSKYAIKILISGTAFGDENRGGDSILHIILRDSEGNVIFSETVFTGTLYNGDKIKDKSYIFKYYNLDPDQVYALSIE